MEIGRILVLISWFIHSLWHYWPWYIKFVPANIWLYPGSVHICLNENSVSKWYTFQPRQYALWCPTGLCSQISSFYLVCVAIFNVISYCVLIILYKSISVFAYIKMFPLSNVYRIVFLPLNPGLWVYCKQVENEWWWNLSHILLLEVFLHPSLYQNQWISN